MTVRGYLQTTRTATYGFLAALPLFVLYESLVLFVSQGEVAQVRVGADVWIKQTIQFLGGQGIFVVGLVVIAIGIWIFVAERKKNIPFRFSYLIGIVGESLIYAVFVAILVSGIVGAIFGLVPGLFVWPAAAPAAGPQSLALPDLLGVLTQVRQPDTGTMLVLSIGAGLYEELVFRVLLVGGLFLGFRRILSKETQAYVFAALIGAAVFSAVHYLGPYGDSFEVVSFVFRFLFGLVLNVLFLLRGFAVAAWTHSIYDVLVVTQLLG